MRKTDLANLLIAKFLEQAPHDLREIQTGLENEDAGRIISAAHRLKGSAANISAELLRQSAAQIETCARQGALAEARACLLQLRGLMPPLA